MEYAVGDILQFTASNNNEFTNGSLYTILEKREFDEIAYVLIDNKGIVGIFSQIFLNTFFINAKTDKAKRFDYAMGII